MIHSSLLSSVLASALLFTTAGTALHAQVQLSDFESTEGFLTGQTVNGKAGWTTSSSSDFQVIDTEAASGTQSLRVRAATNGLLNSPIWLEHDLVGLSLQIRNDGIDYTAGRVLARFRILFADPEGTGAPAQRVLQFQLKHHATVNTSYTLDYYSWENGASVSRAIHFSTALMPDESWGNFRFESDMSDQTYSLWLGDNRLLSGIAIGGADLNADSRISQLQMWGHSSSGEGYTLYDQVVGLQAVPEPGAMTLLGGACLLGGAVAWRKRKW